MLHIIHQTIKPHTLRILCQWIFLYSLSFYTVLCRKGSFFDVACKHFYLGVGNTKIIRAYTRDWSFSIQFIEYRTMFTASPAFHDDRPTPFAKIIFTAREDKAGPPSRYIFRDNNAKNFIIELLSRRNRAEYGLRTCSLYRKDGWPGMVSHGLRGPSSFLVTKEATFVNSPLSETDVASLWWVTKDVFGRQRGSRTKFPRTRKSTGVNGTSVY